jgi:hypothetical protein
MDVVYALKRQGKTLYGTLSSSPSPNTQESTVTHLTSPLLLSHRFRWISVYTTVIS